MSLPTSGIGFSEPFQHTIIDDYIDIDTVREINKQFDEVDWKTEYGRFTVKWNSQDLNQAAQDVVDNVDMELVEQATGLHGLIKDPTLAGAGLHCIPSGGYLNMHCDFNVHPEFGWKRKVNMLLFLNEEWDENWNGQLILAKDPKNLMTDVKYIEPIAGRCVIFETTDNSWHGHPDKLLCPQGTYRKSLAMYFYKDDPLEDEQQHSTVYVK